jgi:hypothetical protein
MITFREYLELIKESHGTNMQINRYAVVGADSKPKLITADEKLAKKHAKEHSLEVRKIFAPRPRRSDVVPIKLINNK